MDFTLADPFDFDSFINWPDDLPPAHDAAGGQEGGATLSPSIGWSMTPSSLDNATFGDAQLPAEVVQGCTANRPDEKIHQVTTALTSTQEGVDASGSGQASSSNNSRSCACFVCLEIGSFLASWDFLHCRFEGCDYHGFRRHGHEKDHYRRDIGSRFYCLVKNCGFSSKRWTDLCRHTTAKHCNNPAKFECSVIGCKYHGEGNGFTRSDKLKDHCRKMHQGQKVAGQAVRSLKPAPASSHAEASGSGNIGALRT